MSWMMAADQSLLPACQPPRGQTRERSADLVEAATEVGLQMRGASDDVESCHGVPELDTKADGGDEDDAEADEAEQATELGDVTVLLGSSQRPERKRSSVWARNGRVGGRKPWKSPIWRCGRASSRRRGRRGTGR